MTTADGRRIDLGVRLDMAREHVERTSLHLRLGDPRPQVDPLVVHLGAGPAGLTGPKLDPRPRPRRHPDRIATPGAAAASGAIATASAATRFSLGATAADADGVVRATGVFVREDGGARTVQHIDLAV